MILELSGRPSRNLQSDGPLDPARVVDERRLRRKSQSPAAAQNLGGAYLALRSKVVAFRGKVGTQTFRRDLPNEVRMEGLVELVGVTVVGAPLEFAEKGLGVDGFSHGGVTHADHLNTVLVVCPTLDGEVGEAAGFEHRDYCGLRAKG